MKKRPVVQGIQIDIPGILSLAHHCRPGLCAVEQNCCSVYEVAIDPDEEDAIVGAIPLASRYAPRLRDGDDYLNVFDDDDDGSLVLDADEDGYCFFSYQPGQGRVLCSLHTVALDLGRPPHQMKPFCCTLWPLCLEGGKKPILTIHQDAFEFPCNQCRPSGVTNLDPGLAAIIQSLWGKDFLDRILALI